jgi:alpha-tubulin suppressor-like RCC1 family protein
MVANVPLSSLAAGRGHVCGLDANQRIRCWGSNTHGQIGNGGVGPSSPPETPAGEYVHVSTGGEHTCAITAASETFCWGRNDQGQLGTFSFVDAYAPLRVGISEATIIGTGRAFSCANVGNGGYPAMECFGSNASGEGAIGYWGRIQIAMIIVPALGGSTVLDGGDGFGCGLNGGAVMCWGDNSYGQLGLGTFSRSLAPLDVLLPE